MDLELDPALRTRLPNLFVIGAGKCGTSSLHAYLDLHPDIGMSSNKEPAYFVRPIFPRGVNAYARLFPPALIRGESSPHYSMWPFLEVDVPGRMKSIVGTAKVVYLVGDPVLRIGAHWHEQYLLGVEQRRFEHAVLGDELTNPANPYLCSSRYASQLERYLEHFARDELLILDQRDLRNHRHESLRVVFSFLGVDPDFDTPEFDEEHNRLGSKLRPNRFGHWLWRHPRLRLDDQFHPWSWVPGLVGRQLARPILSDEQIGQLEGALSDDAQRFRALTGKDFEHWLV